MKTLIVYFPSNKKIEVLVNLLSSTLKADCVKIEEVVKSKFFNRIKSKLGWGSSIYPLNVNFLDYDNIYVNEYCIIHNLDDDKWSEMRYNGEVFEALRLPSSKAIKGKNSLQRCALDALLNKDIGVVAILGGYGSGRMFA